MDSKMVILAIDTATDQLSLTLGDLDGNLIASWMSAVPRKHATLFHPVLDEMLATTDLDIKSIHGIILGVGPGSYTGVRIAVTAAKSFAYVLGIPVVTVSSLEAAAFAAQAHEGVIAVAWDARRQAAYSAAYRSSQFPVHWSPVLSDGRRDLARMSEELIENLGNQEKLLIMGNSAVLLAKMLGHAGFADRIRVYDDKTHMSGEWLFRLGIQKMRDRIADVRSDDETELAHEIVPNYVQATEAETKLLSGKRGDQSSGA